MNVDTRAREHAALGDPVRLSLVDSLWLNDRSPDEIGRDLGLSANHLAHHLKVLEGAGLVVRNSSGGDGRRRYVSLTARGERHVRPPTLEVSSVLYVCTHNAARSQFAEALSERSGIASQSAGSHPDGAVHPLAVDIAGEHGLDLRAAKSKGYEDIEGSPDLVISVCDRAHEGDDPFNGTRLHWSVPDPSESGTVGGFRSAFDQIQERVEKLSAFSSERQK